MRVVADLHAQKLRAGELGFFGIEVEALDRVADVRAVEAHAVVALEHHVGGVDWTKGEERGEEKTSNHELSFQLLASRVKIIYNDSQPTGPGRDLRGVDVNVLFVFFAMAINVALVVHDKINLQNSIDSPRTTRHEAGRNSERHRPRKLHDPPELQIADLAYRVLGTMGLYATRFTPCGRARRATPFRAGRRAALDLRDLQAHLAGGAAGRKLVQPGKSENSAVAPR